ncbi:MAG: site-specific integrase [Verrucomicrobia bacterium]|nr:site-specific integrase [Verrucomicrobiota bacterium]
MKGTLKETHEKVHYDEKVHFEREGWVSCRFKFEGRNYTLQRVPRAGVPERDWVWYTAFKINGVRYHRSMQTNNRAAAQQRAIDTVIRPAKSGELERLRSSRLKSFASKLSQVFEVYPTIAMISDRAIKNNMGSLLLVFRWARGADVDPAKVSLSEVNKDLLRKFQAAMVEAYVSRLGAGASPQAQRVARDRALRSSRSLFNQAKSLFNRDKDLIDQYKAAGLGIPSCVDEFCGAKAQGKLSRDVYYPPDDGIIRETFARAMELPELDQGMFLLFWLSVGTGMRRGEAANATWESMIDRDGRLWVAGGVGKDGRSIQIPVIDSLLKDYTAESPQKILRAARGTGFILPGELRMRHDTIPYKLNLWLSNLGWKDDKKLHALRAFVGSRVFEVDPRTAQYYLRHKSLTTTEKFYSHFSRLNAAVDRL